MKSRWRKRKALTMGLVVLCFVFLAGHIRQPMNDVQLEGMITVAHRGASSYAPENTQAAFQKAMEFGADFLECDVHLSKDGEIVIIHDDTLDRTTNGSGFVNQFTLEELKSLDAGSSYDTSFKGESIITLNELLEEFYGKIGILIEIKNPSLNKGIEEKVVSVLEQYADLKSIVVQSFDVKAMKRIHELNEDIQIAVLMKTTVLPVSKRHLDDLASFATYINFNIATVNKRIVDQIHLRDSKVLVWSKKDKRLIEKANQFGVDGIITDFARWPVEPTVIMAEN
ncbi:glycerophosphodiester phosphodiesterase [Jeotgalibacillus proteolyticus]|uniref:Glycerophosphodiester phosphodiesterase n=1 Tax=Jeotgalibacillus proteolyticus TaxID=2082395 RepID=A0A2S5G8L8_9BACL|nr:glycerophosphodiester phosphodiesterase family protein [Jeotgalibacillus proteolyticus]PPA69273.1 glycerophosphodiester phosphodiesterase [Jeotgalibacillus proteolyticus]